MTKLTVCNVLDWGSMDVAKLEEYVNIAEKWNIDIDAIKNYIENNGDKLSDINAWFYSTISLIFYNIMDRVQDYINIELEEEADLLMEKWQKVQNEFAPFINYLDSWFGNFFDEIDLIGNEEEIIKEIIERLREV